MALYKIVKREMDITERKYEIIANSAQEAMDKLTTKPVSVDVTPMLVIRFDKIMYDIRCEL